MKVGLQYIGFTGDSSDLVNDFRRFGGYYCLQLYSNTVKRN